MGEMSGLSGLLKIMTTVSGPHESVKNKHQHVFLVVVSNKNMFTPIFGEIIQFDDHIFKIFKDGLNYGGLQGS